MTRAVVRPRALVPARLTPPESKSDAQRALVLAHARGRQSPPPPADAPEDTRRLHEGLHVLAHGGGDIEVGDGGAPLRFLLTQAALTPGAVSRFHGSSRLAARPHGPLVEALVQALGPEGLSMPWSGSWPLEVRAPKAIACRAFTVGATQSSQYASSLVLGAATLSARTQQPIEVRVPPPRASEGYLTLTLEWLRAAGFTVEVRGDAFVIGAGSAPAQWPQVPGDWSSGAALLALAWACSGEVPGLPAPEAHPDGAMVAMLKSIGLNVQGGASWRVTGRATKGFDVSIAASPDVALVLAAVSCVLPGSSVLRDVSVLQVKESDRAAGVLELVRAVGGQGRAEGDTLVLEPPTTPQPFDFDAQRDHRRAMAAAVLGVLSKVQVTVEGSEHVVKSFPRFWDELAKTGVDVQQS